MSTHQAEAAMARRDAAKRDAEMVRRRRADIL